MPDSVKLRKQNKRPKKTNASQGELESFMEEFYKRIIIWGGQHFIAIRVRHPNQQKRTEWRKYKWVLKQIKLPKDKDRDTSDFRFLGEKRKKLNKIK